MAQFNDTDATARPSPGRGPRAIVFGCAGSALSDDERRFFADADPVGFILFERNCQDPNQVRALVDDLRDAVGRTNAAVLIDQEGGRVQRLKPPHWRQAPAAAAIGGLAWRDREAAEEAVRLNARLIAAELFDLGITIDCAPVLDVPHPDGHTVIGDRAFGGDADVVSALAMEACVGFFLGGVMPVIKHIPGHGRATADSHAELPVVDADRDDLAAVDFAPFRALNRMPWAMTAHVLYPALDPDNPATTSGPVIEEVIRGDIGFDGVLLSDDIGMKALGGSFRDRVAAALGAGCDVALHCSGEMAEMISAAEGAGPLSAAATTRLARGRAMVKAPDDWDADGALVRLGELLAEARVS